MSLLRCHHCTLLHLQLNKKRTSTDLILLVHGLKKSSQVERVATDLVLLPDPALEVVQDLIRPLRILDFVRSQSPHLSHQGEQIQESLPQLARLG